MNKAEMPFKVLVGEKVEANTNVEKTQLKTVVMKMQDIISPCLSYGNTPWEGSTHIENLTQEKMETAESQNH